MLWVCGIFSSPISITMTKIPKRENAIEREGEGERKEEIESVIECGRERIKFSKR